MSQFRYIERLSFLINYVEHKSYPSMQDIIDHLEDKDLQPTERTLQRDLKTLRDECFIEILYDRGKKGYYIHEDSRNDLQHWIHVFEFFNTARVVNETLLKSGKNIQYIDFERSQNPAVGNTIGVILKAIVDKQKISFTHQSFWRSTEKTVTLSPHLLKQYQNRWYVYGCFDKDEFRSFGLDRITQVSILKDSFKVKVKNVKSVFDDIIGLVFSISEVQTVVLSYNSFQGKYIKTQPLHSSQKILVDDENELRIQLTVRPNYELTEQILKQGERVVVIAPESLRNEIKQRLQDALNNY